VGPDLFVNHLGGLAAEDVHLHRTFDGPYVDLSIPSPFKQISDLRRIDRDVENSGQYLKALHTIIFVASKVYQYTVKLFIDELKQNNAWQVMDFPFCYGLTLVRRVGAQGK
jgi:hypothetical protein